jgi:hypothetical protein
MLWTIVRRFVHQRGGRSADPCSRRSPKLDRGTQCLFQSSLISDAISAEPHVSPDRLKPISFTRSINMSSASETLRASPPCLARRRLVRSGFQPDAYDQRNKLTRVRSRSCNTRLCRRHVGNSSPRAAQMFNTSSKSVSVTSANGIARARVSWAVSNMLTSPQETRPFGAKTETIRQGHDEARTGDDHRSSLGDCDAHRWRGCRRNQSANRPGTRRGHSRVQPLGLPIFATRLG